MPSTTSTRVRAGRSIPDSFDGFHFWSPGRTKPFGGRERLPRVCSQEKILTAEIWMRFFRITRFVYGDRGGHAYWRNSRALEQAGIVDPIDQVPTFGDANSLVHLSGTPGKAARRLREHRSI